MLILHSAFKFKIRQILYITFFVVIDLYNDKGSVQNLFEQKNKGARRLQKF